MGLPLYSCLRSLKYLDTSTASPQYIQGAMTDKPVRKKGLWTCEQMNEIVCVLSFQEDAFY